MIRWSPATRSRPSCPHRRLSRLLAVELSGGAIDASSLRPWASANFVGARHRFACTGAEPANELQQRLSLIEWRLPGHIVADVAVEPGDGEAFVVEVLTVED